MSIPTKTLLRIIKLLADLMLVIYSAIGIKSIMKKYNQEESDDQ